MLGSSAISDRTHASNSLLASKVFCLESKNTRIKSQGVLSELIPVTCFKGLHTAHVGHPTVADGKYAAP